MGFAEVEHDFLKTLLPMVILKLVWTPPNLKLDFFPQDF